MAEMGTPLQVTQALVGHMSDAVTKHYTHISDKVARAAVERLDKIPQTPTFVDEFVDARQDSERAASKLLN